MKKNKTLIAVFTAIIMAGFMISCTESLQLNYDYEKTTDFSTYKTFAVHHLITTMNVNQFNAQRIANAIRAEMVKKGYRETDHHPDLIINAVTIVKDRQNISAYGYGGWYRPYNHVSIQTHNYREGTLVIDVQDEKAQQLVWEGSAYSETMKQPKDAEKAIFHVVSRILQSFPPMTEKNSNSKL